MADVTLANEQQQRIFEHLLQDTSIQRWYDFQSQQWLAINGYFAHYCVLDPAFCSFVERYGERLTPSGGNLVNSVRIAILSDKIDANEPIWESLDLKVESTAHFQKIPASGKLTSMSTAALPEGGHRASGSFELSWDDGTQESFEGPLPLAACSRDYLFVLDGMHGRAALVGQWPARNCPE